MNREIVGGAGAAIYPLTGDVTSTAGSPTVTVTGLQTIPIAVVPLMGGEDLIYDITTNMWTPTIGGGAGTPTQETLAGTLDGVNTVFTISHTPIAETLLVFLNGDKQDVGVEITVTGVTITFTVAPVYDDVPTAFYNY